MKKKDKPLIRFVDDLDKLKREDAKREKERKQAEEADTEEAKASKQSKREKEYFEARKKYPHACLTCLGEGAVVANGNASPRSTNIDVDDWNCPDCLGKGKCPYCGKNFPAGWKRKLDEYLEGEGLPLTCSCGWEDGSPAVLVRAIDARKR